MPHRPPFPRSHALDGCVVIIPVYNHPQSVARVITDTIGLGLPVWVVDDGSTDETHGILKDLDGIHLIRHRRNRGKGAAILTAMTAASESARWALTLDADGQHRPSEAHRLMAAVAPGSRPIVVGNRMGMRAEQAPWTSRFGRGFSNFWIRMAGGPAMADSQSGFRLYPIQETLGLDVRARRFQFEIEVLVKAAWHRLPVVEVPISAAYRQAGRRVSHFHPFFDFLRNFGVFARLITRRVFRRHLS